MASADQNFSAPLRTNRKIAAMARSRPTKATKKFEAKHLTRIVEKRRIHKRNKDKYNKNKAPKKAAEQIAAEEGDAQKKTITHGKGSLFEGMTVDEFLESGGVDEDNLAFAEEDPTDELERSHKAGLKGLKEKDPGFYEFLRENDRELLEFDPDELVEEEDIEDVPVEGGLTESTLSNWDKSLVDERSLGTLKKVLIAVKHAAADITGSEPPQAGNAKYILTDPEGNLVRNLTNWSFRSIVIDGISANSRYSATSPSNQREARKASDSPARQEIYSIRSSSQIPLSVHPGASA